MAGIAGRRVGRLTARQVEAAKKPGLHGDGGGLYPEGRRSGGSKSWMFRHQVSGKVSKYGLGPIHTVSLADARQRAEAIRRQLLDGIDPREARRAEQEAAAVARPSRSASTTRRPPTSRAIRPDGSPTSTPAMAGDADDLRQPGIRQAAGERHRHRHGHAGAGADLVQQERDGVPGAGPHRSDSGMGQGARLSQRREPGAVARPSRPSAACARARCARSSITPRCPTIELPAFMRDLRERYGVAALALEFAILTATRTSETLNAAWSEFDLDNATLDYSRQSA